MANLCIIHIFENRLKHLRAWNQLEKLLVYIFRDPNSYAIVRIYRHGLFTLTAFRLRIMKFSALRIINVINLLQSNFSIPSTCLIVIETRREFIDGSMKTLSLWLRDTMTDSRSTSEELFTSTSGLLWRSIFWELKFSTHMDACRVRFTARK